MAVYQLTLFVHLVLCMLCWLFQRVTDNGSFFKHL